jgi:hypothetical protein
MVPSFKALWQHVIEARYNCSDCKVTNVPDPTVYGMMLVLLNGCLQFPLSPPIKRLTTLLRKCRIVESAERN